MHGLSLPFGDAVVETFDAFAQQVDGVLQAAAGSNVIAFDLDHGRCATWKRGRFRVRMWPTSTAIVVMVELDESYRDDFREPRTCHGARALGERLAAMLEGGGSRSGASGAGERVR